MGAFENQVSENETFESLMALYKTQLRDNRNLRAVVFEQSDQMKELRKRAEKAEKANELYAAKIYVEKSPCKSDAFRPAGYAAFKDENEEKSE